MRKRYDIDGRELHGNIFTAKCHDCGMGLVDAAEFHPYEACEEYRRTHDSGKVWELILPLLREWAAR